MDLLFVTFIVIVVIMLSYVAWEDIGAMLKSNMYKTSKNKNKVGIINSDIDYKINLAIINGKLTVS